MAGIKLLIAPTETPITLVEAKEHSYITIDDDDSLITAMIETATAQTENYTGLQFKDATYMQTLDTWQDEIELLRNPVQSISSIKYYDEDNILQTLISTDFILDDFSLPNKLIKDKDITLPDLKDKVNAIEITFIAGYDTIPSPILSFIKIEFATFYENREHFTALKQNDMPNRFTMRLLDSYKVNYL